MEDDPRKWTVTRTHGRIINEGQLDERSITVKGYRKLRTAPSKESGLSAWWLAYLRGESPKPEQDLGELRVAELFCGPGGLAQGVKQFCREVGLKFSNVAAADIDAQAVAVYQSNHPTNIATARGGKTGDLSQLIDYGYSVSQTTQTAKFESCNLTDPDWELLSDTNGVDLLLAGPPCQGFSDFNNHTRHSDDRNQHYLDVPAVAKALNCPTVIIENVPGVRSDKSGVVQVAKWLFESEGYTVETGVLKASEMGWPQTRKRFFMIASKTNTPIPLSTVGDALAVDPTNALNIEWAIRDHEKTPKDNHMFRQAERSPDNKRRINYLFDNNLYDLPDSERPACHRDKAHSYPTIYGRLRPDEPAPTLTTGFMTNGRGRYTHPTQRRTLNPAEAARIQGFPDDYVFDPDGRRPHNCELLKWIGDAVPMPLGYAVALSALGTQLHNFRPTTSKYSGWGFYKKHPC